MEQAYHCVHPGVIDPGPDMIMQMVDVDPNFNAAGSESFIDNGFKQRSAGYRQKWLGDIVSYRAHPLSESGGENETCERLIHISDNFS
jgi:hypothetical protein